ncbi:ferritin-like metal-binding protein YciE [Arthrobacter stackebrandtii]|uniref:Ferritin-like metal-binding protein YciE n=1 Tax=Arthrobacter stackebrandtii TaxID=272161 RepID=A0ABS4YZK7_9MICC|nr:DUF892 family protein [Arthrobacter stackebrandtii]MBP2414228.1 ferritin-like metal-binding protein YciE [Arthrobacter stackebrandtii]PYG98916.1 hypothetical protein CVV67_17725 [Arthrobacter stackebrandtii]
MFKHIENLKQCFSLLDDHARLASTPATKALARHVTSSAGRTEQSLVDSVVMAGALVMEHCETAAYETFIICAQATGALDVAHLLQENQEQEKSMIEKIKVAATLVAGADG